LRNSHIAGHKDTVNLGKANMRYSELFWKLKMYI